MKHLTTLTMIDLKGWHHEPILSRHIFSTEHPAGRVLTEQEAKEAAARIPRVRRMTTVSEVAPDDHFCPTCGRRQATRWECLECQREY